MSYPTVLYPLTLPDVLHHVLATQSGIASTTLVVCSSRQTFLQDLELSLQNLQGENHDGGLHDLVIPTLHNLSMALHVKVAFCASVQTLLAYLTAYKGALPTHGDSHSGKERLVLVNSIALHAPTSSFSAQGLGRSFAAATEAAIKTGALLQVVECQGEMKSNESDNEDTHMSNDDEAEQTSTEAEDDPWNQEVSILNVSARKYGSGSSERAWAGRTVKVKRIAARWFHFCKLDKAQPHNA